MLVESTEGDLGEEDLSKPRVSDVIKNQNGETEQVIVKKGLLFSKEIAIPADRINSVEKTEDDSYEDRLVIEASGSEIERLGVTGSETLPCEEKEDDPLDKLQEAMPTDEGLRQMEERNNQATIQPAGESNSHCEIPTSPQKQSFFKTIGPGFLGGMSGNDSTAVTAYAVDGARSGYSHLWLMLLATPLLQSVLFASGKIGRVTQKGFSQILAETYGGKVAILASLALIVGNVALIAGDLVAVGSGLELITGLNWAWFVVPVALGLWYITVYQNFDAIKKIFLVLSLAFISYLVTGLLSGADWGAVLQNTVVPRLDFSFGSLSSAVAILGATISPYSMFWQVQGEKEEQRAGSTRQQVKTAALDIFSGVFSGQFVAYFIIISTSATIFTHHQQITTAADAAKALEPLAGPFAKYLFAVGLIGAGLVAIPVLLASTSYALAGSLGLPHSLSKKPWQSEGFYLILTVALLAGLVVALLGFDPIQLMFWANILQAFLAPILIGLIFICGNNFRLMGKHKISWITSLGLIVTGLIMLIGAVLVVYGLVTGQSGS